MEFGFFPQFALQRLITDPERRWHWNVLLSTAMVIMILVFWPATDGPLFRLPHFCLFHSLTGLPCPGCGLLRSLGACCSGNVAGAWALHPAGPILANLGFAQLLFRSWALTVPAGRAARARTVFHLTDRLALVALLGGWLFKFQQHNY